MRNSVGKNVRIDTFEPIYLFLNCSKPRFLDAEDRNDQSAAARKSQFSHRRQRTSPDAAPELGKDSRLLERIYQKDSISFTHFPFCLSVMTRTSQERRLNRHRTNSCERTAGQRIIPWARSSRKCACPDPSHILLVLSSKM